jgi:hypothetical protein
MHNLSRMGFATAYVFLSLIVLFVPPLLPLASAATATGHFEVYCDGVGLFLAKIDGVPASEKLVCFPDSGKHSEASTSDRGSGPTYTSFGMGVSPTASARASPMAEYGLTR